MTPAAEKAAADPEESPRAIPAAEKAAADPEESPRAIPAAEKAAADPEESLRVIPAAEKAAAEQITEESLRETTAAEMLRHKRRSDLQKRIA